MKAGRLRAEPGCSGSKALLRWIVAICAILVSPFTDAAAGSALLVLHDPRAVDGDTLAVDGPSGVLLYVRLFAVAAPELDEPGGEEARAALAEMVAGRTVVCEPVARPSYGRIVAVCRVEDTDLGAEMVGSGLARDCPAFGDGRYAAVEPPSARSLPLPSYCVRSSESF